MKFFKVIFLASILVFTSSLAHAVGRATPFKGWYEIISQRDKAILKTEYFLLDADLLGVLWAKYASDPLPENLEKYRNEPSILAGFTNRDLLFLTLEKGALIGNGYLAIQGGEGDRLELRRRPDGQFDMATKDGGKTTLYLLGAPKENP